MRAFKFLQKQLIQSFCILFFIFIANNVFSENLPAPFSFISGVTTIEEMQTYGYRVISLEEWTKIRRETGNAKNTYLIGGTFPVIALNGVFHEILFRASIGEVPPKEIIGFTLTKEMSPREVLTGFISAGFECTENFAPYLYIERNETKERNMLASYWMFTAHSNKIPNLSFQIFFIQHEFWSWDKKIGLAYIHGINPEEQDTNKKTLSLKTYPTPQEDEKLRALELSLPLSMQNDISVTTLAPLKAGESEPNSTYWQEFLVKTWNIHNKNEYESIFNDINANGQTKSYDDMIRLLDANPNLSPLQITLHEQLESYKCDRLFFVKETRHWLSQRSLRAWDLGRLITLTRWTYGAGYITETEAWEKILPLAEVIYSLYHSREDYLTSYLGGRGFFGAEDPFEYMKDVAELCAIDFSNPSSPQHLPWVVSASKNTTIKNEEAKLKNILYHLSDQQKNAQSILSSLNDTLSVFYSYLSDKNEMGALTTIPKLYEILVPLRIPVRQLPLFYEIRYIEGYLHMVKGDFKKAYEALQEAREYFTNNETLDQYLLYCEPYAISSQSQTESLDSL